MTLSVTNVGANPQQPSISADAFIPDQLIAGNLKLVTDTVTIASGADLVRGSVLGQITIGAATVAAAGAGTAGANTGNGTCTMDATAPIQAGAKTGTYLVKCTAAATNGGVFQVEDPDGYVLGNAVVGTAFVDDIKFLIADGSSDFIVGDAFAITVAAGSGKYKLAASTATDGSAVPVAILADKAAAASADVLAGIYQMGEFNGAALTLGTGTTLAAAKAALAPRGIFIKTAVSAADPT